MPESKCGDVLTVVLLQTRFFSSEIVSESYAPSRIDSVHLERESKCSIEDEADTTEMLCINRYFYSY